MSATVVFGEAGVLGGVNVLELTSPAERGGSVSGTARQMWPARHIIVAPAKLRSVIHRRRRAYR